MLYLPKSRTADPARPAAAHVPEGTASATRPTLAVAVAVAVAMIERTIAADMPFAWVATDAAYGADDIEQAPRRAGKGYVLGMKRDHRFGSWSDKPVVAGTATRIASDLDPAAWHRLLAGRGTKPAVSLLLTHPCRNVQLRTTRIFHHKVVGLSSIVA